MTQREADEHEIVEPIRPSPPEMVPPAQPAPRSRWVPYVGVGCGGLVLLAVLVQLAVAVGLVAGVVAGALVAHAQDQGDPAYVVESPSDNYGLALATTRGTWGINVDPSCSPPPRTDVLVTWADDSAPLAVSVPGGDPCPVLVQRFMDPTPCARRQVDVCSVEAEGFGS